MRNKIQNICINCKQGYMIPKDMWLFEIPKIFTLAIQWEDSDNPDKTQIASVFKIIRPILRLSTFFTLSNEQKIRDRFVFRGFIGYYGYHYIAIFYN